VTLTGGLRPRGLPSAARVGSGLAMAAASNVAGSGGEHFTAIGKKMQNICYLHAVEKVRDVGLVASCIHEGIVTMTLTGGLRPHGLPSAARVVSGLPLPVASDFERMYKQQVMA